jgi:hypothetical protein
VVDREDLLEVMQAWQHRKTPEQGLYISRVGLRPSHGKPSDSIFSVGWRAKRLHIAYRKNKKRARMEARVHSTPVSGVGKKILWRSLRFDRFEADGLLL